MVNSQLRWSVARDAIGRQEAHIREEYGMTLSVYGTGSQGYKLLAECLNRGEYLKGGRTPAADIWVESGRRSHILHKQVHEYWVFLVLVERLLNGYRYEGSETIYYRPVQGSETQRMTFFAPDGSLFVEPCLTGYDESRILSAWERRLTYLTAKQTRNVRPDFLVAGPDLERLPWGAWLYNSGGLADEQQQEDQWERVRSEVSWLLECKHTVPTAKDLSQTLWYALAYRVPVVLLVQEQIPSATREAFEADAAQLDTPVQVIDKVTVGEREQSLQAVQSVI